MQKGKKFCYWFLSENEQKIYRRFNTDIAHIISDIEVDICSKETLANVIRAVLIDNPQYFWFDGRVSMKRAENKYIIKPYYLHDNAEIKIIENKIENLLTEFRENSSACDYEKAMSVYDWLLKSVSYSIENSGQTIYNVFVERKAVCKGLSKAYQFMLSKLEIFSTLVYGTIDRTTKHIWNVVEIDGEHYNVDVSLGYSQFDYLFDVSKKSDKYRTFLKSDAEFACTHILLKPDQPHLICKNDYKRDVR